MQLQYIFSISVSSHHPNKAQKHKLDLNIRYNTKNTQASLYLTIQLILSKFIIYLLISSYFTAETQDNRREPILNASYVKATPFSYGAGHVLPNSAMDPGLVYDLSINDYLDFICALGYNETQVSMFSDNPYKCSKLISLANLNYPSITIAKLSGSITVTRTLKNVGSPGTYRAHIQEPSGILVIVKPESLKFRKVDEEKSFNITLMVREAKASEDYVFGRLIWSDEKHFVKSPIVVKAV